MNSMRFENVLLINVLLIPTFLVAVYIWELYIWKAYVKHLDEYVERQKCSFRNALKELHWQRKFHKTILLAITPPVSAFAILHVFWFRGIDIIALLTYGLLCATGVLLILWFSLQDGSINKPLGRFRNIQGAWISPRVEKD